MAQTSSAKMEPTQTEQVMKKWHLLIETQVGDLISSFLNFSFERSPQAPPPAPPRPMSPNDLLYIITSRWISISNSHPTNYPSLFSSNRSKSLALKLYPLRTSQRIFTHCCTTEFRSHAESFTLLFVPHSKDSRPDQSETSHSIEKHNLRILLLCFRFYTVEKEVSLWHCLRKIASDEY